MTDAFDRLFAGAVITASLVFFVVLATQHFERVFLLALFLAISYIVGELVIGKPKEKAQPSRKGPHGL